MSVIRLWLDGFLPWPSHQLARLQHPGTKASAPTRLYVKGVFCNFKRSQRNQYARQAICKIEGVEGAKFAILPLATTDA